MLTRVEAHERFEALFQDYHDLGEMLKNEDLGEVSPELTQCEHDTEKDKAGSLSALVYSLKLEEMIQQLISDLNSEPWLLRIHSFNDLPNQVTCLSLHLYNVIIR